jgi:hypothetical protein
MTGAHTYIARGNQPTELTADLTTAELAEALALLRFHGDEARLIALDRGVRDYLVSALSAQGRKT